MRPLATASLGAPHRARAVLPTPQGCDRCSRIRKPECERLACKAAPFCGVLALARPSTSPIRRNRRVGYPNTKLREPRTARRRPQQSPIRSPGSALRILQAEHFGLIVIGENLRISRPIYHGVERFLGGRVACMSKGASSSGYSISGGVLIGSLHVGRGELALPDAAHAAFKRLLCRG